MNLSEINTNSAEGRMLIAALSLITVAPELNIKNKKVDGRNLEPDTVLNIVLECANKIYEDNPLLDSEHHQPETFLQKISTVINQHSKENGSNTPDFVLAEYLQDCLNAFDKCSRGREKWYGKELKVI